MAYDDAALLKVTGCKILVPQASQSEWNALSKAVDTGRGQLCMFKNTERWRHAPNSTNRNDSPVQIV